MQTAPATSQKTPKVANDDFLSTYETPLGPGRRQQDDWQHGHRPEREPERACEALLDTEPIVVK
jgi:hypothetical protein